MVALTYETLSTFAKIICGAYRAGNISDAILLKAKTDVKITADEYTFIKN